MPGLKKYCLYTIMLLVSTVSLGQGNISNLFKTPAELGDEMFQDLYFEQAAEYYLLGLKKDNDPSIMLKLANTYRVIGEYEEALDWYERAYEIDPIAGVSLDRYYYAECLLSAGDTERAKNEYNAYANAARNDLRPQEKIQGIEIYPLLLRDSSLYEIDGLSFNSRYSDFGATTAEDGLVFSSARGLNSFVDPDYLREEDLMDLYMVREDTAGWTEPILFSEGLSTHFHEGPVAFFEGGDAMILTQSNQLDKKAVLSSDGRTKPQLYMANKVSGDWSVSEKLSINDPSYSMAHPAITQTGDTLYFSSDKPGGYGGNDIYRAILKNGKWTDITNLGSFINSRGDEMYPFIVQDRLYFASNGHESLGGLDIYKANLWNGTVTGIENMGYPVNSRFDDFGFSIDPETMKGYFTSNRPGGMGSDDIYAIKITAHALKGKALTTQDNSPISDAMIRLFLNGELLDEMITDGEGNFHFYLPFNSDFELEAEKSGYTFEDRIPLSTRGNPVDLDSIYISLRFQDLFVKGIVYDNQTQAGLEDAKVYLYNLTDDRVDSTITATDGSYSFPISPKKEFTMRATKYHFFPDSLKFTSFGIEKGEILNDFILNEEYVEKQMIYFDFDSDVLRSQDRPVLNKVLDLLKQFPEDFLIIGAHADARGTVEYNQELSDRRAANTRKFFIDRGVAPSKIIARGFGEAFIINRCTDGANCQEEDHSKNRRTEITVERELNESELKK